MEERINGWVASGFITEAQATKLRADVLLAQGRESEENLSQTGVGGTLLVICALLNGAVLMGSSFLSSSTQGGALGALGLWALSLAPMVYVLRHTSLAGVMSCLVYVLVWLLVFGDASLADLSTRILHVPALFLAAGVLVFAIGGTHYLLPSLASVARGLRLAGIYMVLAMLFVLGFASISSNAGGAISVSALDTAARFSRTLGILVGLGAAFSLLNMWVRRRTPRVTRPEGPISLAMLALSLLHFFVPLPGLFYMVLFNLVLMAMISTLLVVGVRWRDQKVVDLASGSLLLVLLARYYDLAWAHMGFGSFVMGGLLLVAIIAPGLFLARRHVLQPAPDATPASVPRAST